MMKGVNLGGWLMMEGYILRGRNITESEFKSSFKKVNGERGLAEFEDLFRANFIREQDFRNIRSLGADLVRVPFNYRLIDKTGEGRFRYFDNVLRWARKYGLKIVLDMHAAPGAQNVDWHSDNPGRALLWEQASCREKTCALWEEVVDRYKDHPALYGYDVLNEPVLGATPKHVLKRLYADIVRRITAIDKTHLLFLEGNNWAQHIDFLSDLLDDRVRVSIHYYNPLNYTFNYRPFYTFPGRIDGEKWDAGTIRRSLEGYCRFAEKNGTRIYVGEFGLNARNGCFGESRWLDAIMSAFEECGFDYTYWTYKAVANDVFPDGIYQYLPNPPWVRREGPVYGWENYAALWKENKRKIVDSWRTENYTPSAGIVETLKKHLKK